MRLNKSNILFYDLEEMLKVARKNSFLGLKSKEFNAILRKFEPLKIFYENFELQFLDFRVMDNTTKDFLEEIINYLKSKKVIKAREDILRNLEGYHVFDGSIFEGVEIIKPALFFGEENVFYPKNKERKAQALVRYPDEIERHLANRKVFHHLVTLEQGKRFRPTNEEKALFECFFHIKNIKTKEKSYFGVWG